MKKPKKVAARSTPKEAVLALAAPKQGWSLKNAFLFAISIAAVIFTVARIQSRQEVVPSPTAMPTARPTVALVRRWVDGTEIPNRPYRNVNEVMGSVDTLATTIPVSPEPTTPITDTRFIGQIAEARTFVQQISTLPGAWAWEEVRREVAQIGTHRTVFLGTSERWMRSRGLRFTHDLAWDAYTSRPEAIVDFSQARLARLLIHEATHAVHAREIRARGGYTVRQFIALTFQCRDVLFADLFLTETLAHWNEAAFQARFHDTPTGTGNLLEAAVQAFQGTAEGPRQFASVMGQYALHQMPDIPDARNCGLPPIFAGPGRGQRFFLPEIGADILAPMYNALLLQLDHDRH